jgi:c-di-GMP-binding flagellar brake protein YcgR
VTTRRGIERRRFVRVAEQGIASVISTGRAARDGHTLNFSAGGVLLVFDHYIAPWTPVRISLNIDSDIVSFEALVVRVRTLSDHTHEIAAEFVGGSAADQRRLQQLITTRLAPTPSLPPLTA